MAVTKQAGKSSESKSDTKQVKDGEVVKAVVDPGKKEKALNKTLEDAKDTFTGVVEEGLNESRKGPRVIINGKEIEPRETGIKPNGPDGSTYVAGGREFYLPYDYLYNRHTRQVDSDEPWIVRTSLQGPEMSLFVFNQGGYEHFLLLDEHSSFIRTDDHYFRGSRKSPASLIMINSRSFNDDFVGRCFVGNVETEDCTLNESELIVLSKSIGSGHGWDISGEQFKQSDKRFKFERLRLKKSHVVDSDFTGRIDVVHSQLNNSTIVAHGRRASILLSVHLQNTRVVGSRALLGNVTMEKVGINTEGAVHIRGVKSLKNLRWSFAGVYLNNRFSFTEIETVARGNKTITMVRINRKEVQLSQDEFSSKLVKLPLNATREQIQEVAKTLVTMKPYIEVEEDAGAAPQPPAEPAPFGYLGRPMAPWTPPRPGDFIKEHVIRYVTDQIVSRLEMIHLLDEVENASQCVNGGPDRDDGIEPDFYD